jgi:hypothetical protein
VSNSNFALSALALLMFSGLCYANEPNYYYCHTSSETAGQLFISDVFQADPGLEREIQSRFREVVVINYHAEEPHYQAVTCYYSLDEEESIDNRDDYLENHLNGRTQIDVEFNY